MVVSQRVEMKIWAQLTSAPFHRSVNLLQQRWKQVVTFCLWSRLCVLSRLHHIVTLFFGFLFPLSAQSLGHPSMLQLSQSSLFLSSFLLQLPFILLCILILEPAGLHICIVSDNHHQSSLFPFFFIIKQQYKANLHKCDSGFACCSFYVGRIPHEISKCQLAAPE